jgi:DNA ligase-1
VPEVVEAAAALAADQIVLDGETVALDAAGKPRPFQTTMRRLGRKLDVAALRLQLPLHVYFFDCLLLGEHSLVDQPARARFAALDQIVPMDLRTPRIISGNDAQAQEFYAAALRAGHEGVVAKSLSAPYEAGNRGAGWLKIKRIHTLDLVVLAAEWGHGRRTGMLSNLHLGARDPQHGGYVMLGKTFKGLTDDVLRWQTAELLVRELHRDQWTVYVRPELVVEIAFNDIQASSHYPGGLALRFARVKRYRADKRVEDADTIQTIRTLYVAQSGIAQSPNSRIPEKNRYG